jgi:large subunit ribosomal protein L23
MGIFDRFLKKKQPEKKEVKEKKLKAKKEAAPVEKQGEKYSTLKMKAEPQPEAPKAVKGKKVKKAGSEKSFQILIKPLITEKATNLVALNKYAFKVKKTANRIEVKKAIRDLYGVEPIKVNIINERGKRIIYGRVKGKKSNWKKAIITLNPKDKLEIYEGV